MILDVNQAEYDRIVGAYQAKMQRDEWLARLQILFNDDHCYQATIQALARGEPVSVQIWDRPDTRILLRW